MNNKRRLNKILIYAKKIKAVNLLGGCCKKCGEKEINKLCFHHLNDKSAKISTIKYNRWSKWESELIKCELMCHNCHIEFHFNSKEKKTFRFRNKLLFLDYVNQHKCKNCNYSKCLESLQFHHLNDKIFEMRSIQKSFLDNLDSSIKKELDKCEVLCSNCHVYLHSDKEFYLKNEDEILKRVNDLREHSKKIDKDIFISLYQSGLSKSEIMNILGCKKSAYYNMLGKIKKDLVI